MSLIICIYNRIGRGAARLRSKWETVVTQLKATFRYRVAGGADNDDLPESNGRAVINTIYGNTVKWNQVITNGNFATTNGWSVYGGTASLSDGVYTYTPNSPSGSTRIIRDTSFVQGHIYYVSIWMRPNGYNSDGLARFSYTGGGNIAIAQVPITNGIWTKVSGITAQTTDGGSSILFYCNAGSGMSAGQTCSFKNAILFDLTDIFGTDAEIAAALGISVADITTDTGVAAFEAWLALNVGEQDYYPYDEGSLISFKGTGIKTYIDGWNQLVKNGNFYNDTTTYWNTGSSTVSVSDGVVTMSGIKNGTFITSAFETSANNVYYIRIFAKGNVEYSRVRILLYGEDTTEAAIPWTYLGNSLEKYSTIWKKSGTNTQFRVYGAATTASSSEESNISFTNVNCINLTELFGTDAQIAAALGIEEADITTSTGVAAFEEWLQVHIGRQDYYEYTQPSKFPVDEKPFDVTKVYGKLGGEGSLVQVFPDGMFEGLSDQLPEDYIEYSDGYMEAVAANKKIDLGDCAWSLVSGCSHTFETTIDITKAEAIGYTFSDEIDESDTTQDKLIGFTTLTHSLTILDRSLSSTDLVDGHIAALEGVDAVYAFYHGVDFYQNLVYRDNGTDTPLEEIFPIKYKVDKYSTEELLVPASVSGEPTSTAIIADIEYQKK